MQATGTLDIVTVNSPKAGVLRRRARPVGKVTAEIQRLVEDMLTTLQAANGLGLAAPQVGESLRLLVAKVEARTVVLVDPELIRAEGKEIATEACLSIPGVVAEVRRSAVVTIRGKNRRGRKVTIVADKLLGRVLQHELDHLDGILFLDRVSDPNTIRYITSSDDDAPAAK